MVESASEAPDGWSELARATGSFYHEPAWIDGLARCFGLRVTYLALRTGRSLVGGLPLAEVPGLLGKRRLVSLPFSYAAGPFSAVPGAAAALCDAARTLAMQRGVSRVEVKHFSPPDGVMPGYERVSKYATYRVSTEGGPDAVWKRLHPSMIQRSVKKARKSGVQVVRGASAAEWGLMADLQERTSHRLGLPAPPRRFFLELCRTLQDQGLADLYLAYLPQGAAAAAIMLWKGTREWIYAFGASLPQFLEYRPNHVLIWTALEDAARAGITFDLGRAAPEQQGLVEFKERWGGVPRPLAYDYWPHAGGLNAKPRDRGALALAGRVWTRLPFAVARRGAFLYRYLG
ncbi:MAG TPA: GNAT family N-acetyltransferase [Gemmatimonadaceae bacterium]|nr:GNAT family N-acetyltransferase [Gemmatimonadaceae bacterium]